MDLTLTQAAAMLGKTPRQVRYLIKTGRLAARKDGAHWLVGADDLPLSDGQRRAAASRIDAVRRAADDALAPVEAAAEKAGRKRFSVRDLRAWRTGAPVYQAVRTALGDAAPAVAHLRRSLDLLGQGCHAFRPEEKSARYAAAREEAASAAVALLLSATDGDEARARLADRVEQEYLPDVTSLVRTTERAARRTRFDRFGAGRG